MDHRTTEPIDQDSSLIIRPFQLTDDVAAITALLHAAYKPLADMGLRYMATHQSDAVTLDRLRAGESYIALDRKLIVGTIALYAPTASSNAEYYRRTGVYHFGQYGVLPSHQQLGIGAKLLRHVSHRALQLGATELALDTAMPAQHLIDLYVRYGFNVVDEVQWPDVNYRSVIMSKRL